MSDLVQRLRSDWPFGDRTELCNEAADEIERLRADAERYRWLRANMTGVIQLMGRPGIGLSGMTGNDFDDAIDAALKETP